MWVWYEGILWRLTIISEQIMRVQLILCRFYIVQYKESRMGIFSTCITTEIHEIFMLIASVHIWKPFGKRTYIIFTFESNKSLWSYFMKSTSASYNIIHCYHSAKTTIYNLSDIPLPIHLCLYTKVKAQLDITKVGQRSVLIWRVTAIQCPSLKSWSAHPIKIWLHW